MATDYFFGFLEMSSPQQSKFMIPSILMQSKLFSKTVLQCVLLTAEETEYFVFSNFSRTKPGKELPIYLRTSVDVGHRKKKICRGLELLCEPNTTSTLASSVLICNEADHLKDESAWYKAGTQQQLSLLLHKGQELGRISSPLKTELSKSGNPIALLS